MTYKKERTSTHPATQGVAMGLVGSGLASMPSLKKFMGLRKDVGAGKVTAEAAAKAFRRYAIPRYLVGLGLGGAFGALGTIPMRNMHAKALSGRLATGKGLSKKERELFYGETPSELMKLSMDKVAFRGFLRKIREFRNPKVFHLESDREMLEMALKSNALVRWLTKDPTRKKQVLEALGGARVAGTVAPIGTTKNRAIYLNKGILAGRHKLPGVLGPMTQKSVLQHERFHLLPILGHSEIGAHIFGGAKVGKGFLNRAAYGAQGLRHLARTRPGRLGVEAAIIAGGAAGIKKGIDEIRTGKGKK